MNNGLRRYFKYSITCWNFLRYLIFFVSLSSRLLFYLENPSADNEAENCIVHAKGDFGPSWVDKHCFEYLGFRLPGAIA